MFAALYKLENLYPQIFLCENVLKVEFVGMGGL